MPNKGPLTGCRITTRVVDANDVERGTVTIPIGWTARIGDLQDDHYAVIWDDDRHGQDMGWCLWTEIEILRDAQLIVEVSHG